MSTFLGPIHHWLYRKIQLQEALTTAILQASLPVQEWSSRQKLLEDAHGPAATRPLEEIIDTGNIHDWLQGRISAVESRFACLVTELLASKPTDLDTLKQTFFVLAFKLPLLRTMRRKSSGH